MGGENSISHVQGRLGGILGVAALTAAVVFAPVPAQAGSATVGQPITYTCTGSALSVLPARLPLAISSLGQTSGEAGAAVSPLTSTTTLVQALGSAVTGPLTVTSNFAPTFQGAALASSFGSDGGLSTVLPPVPDLPAGTVVPILAPSRFDATLSALGLPIGTLTCAIDDAAADVLGSVMVTATAVTGDLGGSTGSTGGTGGTGGTGSTGRTGHTGGGATSSPGADAHGVGGTVVSASGSTAHHVPSFSLRAHLLHGTIHGRARAKVRVVLTASDGRPVSGTAVVKRGERTLGSHRLRSGRATVTLRHLRPGRYRLKVLVDGLTRTLTLRVRR